MKTAFLDTDICIGILRGKEPALESKLKGLSMSSVQIPSVVAADLWVGAEKSEHPARAASKLETFLRDLKIAPFDDTSARKYGEIRANLEKHGTTIGGNDLLIAATVLSRGGTLITRTHREFKRVPQLVIERW